MRGKKEDTVITTILGPDCLINGDFIVKQSARIDGEVQGNVFVSGTLVMGAGARIEGNIEANEDILGGAVTGNIDA
ncbi:MAG: polymer-forming cytoskeletal protein, partial [Acetatifactor sp.]|nr:polymer-forming cytoskeletal protein [Acetatifactor sp.]